MENQNTYKHCIPNFSSIFQYDIMKTMEYNSNKIKYSIKDFEFMSKVLDNSSDLNNASDTKSIVYLLYEMMWKKYNMDNLIKKNISENEIKFLFENLDNIKNLILLYSRKSLLLIDYSLYNSKYKFLQDNRLDFMDIYDLFGKNKKAFEKTFLENFETTKIKKLNFFIFHNVSLVNEKYSTSEQVNLAKLILLATTSKNIPLGYVSLNNINLSEANNTKIIFNAIYNIKKHFDNVNTIKIHSNIKLLQKQLDIFKREEKNIDNFTKGNVDVKIVEKEDYNKNITKDILFILENQFSRKHFNNMVVWNNSRIEGYCFINFIALFFASNLFSYLEVNDSKRNFMSIFLPLKTKTDKYFDSLEKMSLVKVDNKNYKIISKSKKTTKKLKKLGINTTKKIYTLNDLNKIFDDFKMVNS